MNMCKFTSIYISIYQKICSNNYLSLSLSICLFIYPNISLFIQIYLSIDLFICLSTFISLSNPLSFFLLNYLSTFLFLTVYLSIYLSFFPVILYNMLLELSDNQFDHSILSPFNTILPLWSHYTFSCSYKFMEFYGIMFTILGGRIIIWFS